MVWGRKFSTKSGNRVDALPPPLVSSLVPPPPPGNCKFPCRYGHPLPSPRKTATTRLSPTIYPAVQWILKDSDQSWPFFCKQKYQIIFFLFFKYPRVRNEDKPRQRANGRQLFGKSVDIFSNIPNQTQEFRPMKTKFALMLVFAGLVFCGNVRAQIPVVGIKPNASLTSAQATTTSTINFNTRLSG